jgi:hypothetical protein
MLYIIRLSAPYYITLAIGGRESLVGEWDTYFIR